MLTKTNFPQKVALITGAARRVGAEIARTLHSKGINVIIHYRSHFDAAKQLAEKLNGERANSACIAYADLSEIDSYASWLADLNNRWGRLDILVNNASRFYATPLVSNSNKMLAAWNELMASNLQAPFFLAKSIFPYISLHQGSIINIADIHASIPLKNYGIYCISKAGLVMLTKVLAKEMAPDVRVNAVSPGAVLWPESENELSDERKQKIIDETALKSHGSPKHIAETVQFFIDHSYITGQILAVDGGRYL